MSAARWLALAIAMSLAACGGGGSVGGGGALPASLVGVPPPVAAAAPPGAAPCSVGLWGDSILALVTPLLDPGFTYNAHTVIGGTAAAALPAFLQDPLAERFQVIGYGTNDANGLSDLQAPLGSMLARTAALGRVAVLTGIPRETAGMVAVEGNYDLWMGTLGVAYANWGSLPAGQLMSDGVHPADRYQQELADKLNLTLETLAPECRK